MDKSKKNENHVIKKRHMKLTFTLHFVFGSGQNSIFRCHRFLLKLVLETNCSNFDKEYVQSKTCRNNRILKTSYKSHYIFLNVATSFSCILLVETVSYNYIANNQMCFP